MRLKNISMAVAALGLAVAPAAIQAQAAERANAPVSAASEMGGGNDTLIGVIAAAVLVAFIALTVSNDDDLPVSA